jgi:tetratricopeptide (TPR) repeat protein
MLSSCGGYSSTPRQVAGVPIDDRPIAAAAYAYYLDGAELEAGGKWEAALGSFRQAQRYDGSSVDVQTRIAALTCRLTPEDAEDEFEAASDLDETFEPLWREWAECELRHGKLTRALRLAKLAVTHSPETLEATLVLSRVHEARREPTLALRPLIAYVLRYPSELRAWRALFACADRQHDAVWKQRAADELSLHARNPNAGQGAAEQRVVDALLDRGLSVARDIAIEENVSDTELAWLALENDRPSEAIQQATLVLRADPARVDAAITLLVAGHRTGNRDVLTYALAALRKMDDLELSPRAAHAFGQLLERTVSEQAGASFSALWRSEHGELPPENVAPEPAAPQKPASPSAPPEPSNEALLLER